MANESPNPLFAYVEARIAAWQAVLASLKAALSLDPSGKAGEGIDLSSIAVSGNGSDIGQPIDLPDGAFFGKSIPACVKLYLSAARRKKTSKEITAALKDGGVESTGNFDSVVTTALNRLRNAGEVLKFKDGWGLSEWYPANMRASSTVGKQPAKPKKKGKKAKGKGKTVVASMAKTAPQKVTEITQTEDKPEPRILAFLNRQDAAANEIAAKLGLKIQTAHLVLGKLVHQKKIEKLPSGHFKALGAVAS